MQRCTSYRRDVVLCARLIYLDLTRGRPAHGFCDLLEICQRHGGPPLFDPAVSWRRRAYARAGNLHLSPALTLDELREVVPHELVHRLADEPRWAWINRRIDGWRYDRRQFREAVALLVGKLFVREARRAARRSACERARESIPAVLRAESVLAAVRAEIAARTGVELEAREIRRLLGEMYARDSA